MSLEALKFISSELKISIEDLRELPINGLMCAEMCAAYVLHLEKQKADRIVQPLNRNFSGEDCPVCGGNHSAQIISPHSLGYVKPNDSVHIGNASTTTNDTQENYISEIRKNAGDDEIFHMKSEKNISAAHPNEKIWRIGAQDTEL